MEKGVNHDRIAAWRWVASILIYPVTVLPGLNAAVLLISSVCVGLDSWSLEGALSNMSLGFPWRHSGSCGLCDSSHTGRQRPRGGGYRPRDPTTGWIACDREHQGQSLDPIFPQLLPQRRAMDADLLKRRRATVMLVSVRASSQRFR